MRAAAFLAGQSAFQHRARQQGHGAGQPIQPVEAVPGFDERPEDFLLQNRDWAFCSVSDRIRYLKTHASLSQETRRDYLYEVPYRTLYRAGYPNLLTAGRSASARAVRAARAPP